jgi:HemY protein
MPVSPVTGRLDAFQWKIPVAELGGRAADEPAPVLIDATPREEARDEPREVASPPLSAEPAGPFNGGRSAIRPAARPAAAAPIIPLSHVPDDPGPDPEGTLDAELAAAPRAAPWQRFRQLFR